MVFKYCKKCCTITPHKNVILLSPNSNIKQQYQKECTFCKRLT